MKETEQDSKETENQRKSHSCSYIKALRVVFLFKDPFEGSIFPNWQHLSDWSSGPKHFTIFVKNC